MKGIVFIEFLDLVSQKFGEDVTDRIIEDSNLPSGAAYTTVGTYDHAEMIAMVQKLSGATNMPVPDLLRAVGEHLFARFAERYGQFIAGIGSSFEFLSAVEAHIHVEVRKLHPDAELPSIQCNRLSENILELVYRSTRPFAALAEGLMRGAIAHFGEAVDVRTVESAGDGTYIRFELQRS